MKLSFTKDYIFHTVQGEGIHNGVPSLFLRLSGCNLRCEWQNPDGSKSLCDTPYSSHQPEKDLKEIDQVIKDLKSYDCRYLVITGGEPFLQKNIVSLIEQLKQEGFYVCIETNGSIYLETKADLISLSPKLSSSCVLDSDHYNSHHSKRLNIEALALFCKNHEVQLKFVVNEEKELEEIKNILTELKQKGLDDLHQKVLLMPQAVSLEQLQNRSEQVIEWCKKESFRFCDRTHIRIWGDKRGV